MATQFRYASCFGKQRYIIIRHVIPQTNTVKELYTVHEILHDYVH